MKPTRENRSTERKNLFRCHLIYHKYDINCFGLKAGPKGIKYSSPYMCENRIEKQKR